MFKAIYAREGLRRPRGLLAGHMANGAVSQVGEENDTAAAPPHAGCSLFPKVHFRAETRGETRQAWGPCQDAGLARAAGPCPDQPRGAAAGTSCHLEMSSGGPDSWVGCGA